MDFMKREAANGSERSTSVLSKTRARQSCPQDQGHILFPEGSMVPESSGVSSAQQHVSHPSPSPSSILTLSCLLLLRVISAKGAAQRSGAGLIQIHKCSAMTAHAG